jgi:glycosyltransferase involved in cell wall biosynthesis
LRILFVTWDGPQVNYVESLFVPIFRGLAEHGIDVGVLQFRWGTKAQEEQVRRHCLEAGVGYRAVQVMRRGGGLGPFATGWFGARHVRAAVRAFGSDVIMPRSVLASIPVLRAGGGKLKPILLDADGFAIDERVDFAGLSPKSLQYRILRDVEAQSVREAQAVIVRSEAAKQVLVSRAGPPVTQDRFFTVTNGRDDRTFHPHDDAARAAVRAELGIPADAPLLVYAGSVGPQYRFDLIGELAGELAKRRPDARLLVLSGSPDEAQRALAGRHDLAGRVTVMRAAPNEVPRYLAAADVGAAFRTPTFSTRGVAPVKLSEYLLCGVPVVGTVGIGDTQAAQDAGMFFDDRAGMSAAVQWVMDSILPAREGARSVARRVGVERFSLRRSVEDYLSAIKALDSPDG